MFKNYDTIICPDNIKKQILEQISNEKKIINLKFYTLNEFKKAYFGTYKVEAIYYLMKKYNYKYDVALTHLDNYYFDSELKEELEENELIIKEKININKIIIIGYNKIDKNLLDEITKYDYEIIEEKEQNYKNKVYEFNTKEEEINFIIKKIIDLQKTIDLNDICLVNVGSEYINDIERLFKFNNIPINLNIKKSIYGTTVVKNFLKNLKENKEIILENDEISKLIVKIVNKYAFRKIDDTIIECIEAEIKKTYLKNVILDCAINLVSIDEIDDSKYYFVLGFNEGILPKPYIDEDYYSDKLKEKMGILTSVEKNILDKKLVINKISRKNVILSCRLKDGIKDLYPSSIIEELNLEVIKEKFSNYNSNLYNKLVLGKKLDNLIKYNEVDDELNLLYSNYIDINYLTYSNKFTGINNNLFNKFINNKLLLSYSSIDDYNKCGFRYYISNILKLDEYNETFMAYIGNLFHYILSIYNNDNFDFELEFNKFINNKELNNKEKFFIQKLKKDLIFIINVLKQYEEYSELNKSLYEEKIYVNKDANIKVTFLGVVDRIMYKEENNKTYIAIIDYKTGNPDINLDYSIYGLNMQLPIYLYLIKNSKIKNPEFIGFYLDKLIHNKPKYNEDILKKYKLEGYTIDNENLISIFDKTYMDSKMIKNMKITSNGFSSYAKTISKDQIDKLIELVDKKIDEARDNILSCNFEINPKRIDNELVGCKYCKYKDVCFMKEEDIVDLKKIKFEDFLF